MSKTIVFTGGGSAGHVTGNLVLIPKCAADNWSIHYIGSEQGIERQLLSGHKEVTYHSIATGKLRRYLAWANVTDVFKVMKGIIQAYRLIKRIKPNLVFSKGGFVSVPVVIGARLNRVPIIIHEPDLNLGLANRLSLPFATTLTTTFKETAANVHTQKGVYVGPILKEEFHYRRRGLSSSGIVRGKPILLVMGGSQGAQSINRIVTEALSTLLDKFQVIHICGKGKVDHSISLPGYRAYEFVTDELPELLAMADVVVSRAGSSSIMELLALQKPMLLIPHTNGGSRSGQLAHAQYFQRAGFADMLLEEHLTALSLVAAIMQLYENRITYSDTMNKHEKSREASPIMDLIRLAASQTITMAQQDQV